MSAQTYIDWDGLALDARRDFQQYAQACQDEADRQFAREQVAELSKRLPKRHGHAKRSRYHGVSWDGHNQARPWRVVIRLVEGNWNVGSYATELQAAHAHDAAARGRGCTRVKMNFG